MLSDAKNKLDAEVSRLEMLYFVSIILYRREVKAKYRETRGGDRPITFKTSAWTREVAKNAGHFKKIVEDTLPRNLRETIFVRLVSALEVFLTDVVREIYAGRRDLLQTDSTLELQYRFLASIKSVSQLFTWLVDRDCRTLTSGGFRAIEKYYRQRFSIELNAIAGFKALSEIHERRHLLVHRLGFTDEQYRHTYRQKVSRISIEEDYLLRSIKTIRDFSDEVIQRATATLGNAQARSHVRGLADLDIDVEVASLEAEQLTSADYSFLYNERYYSIRDLLQERSVTDRRVTLKLRGEQNVLRVYLRKLKRLASEKKLTIKTPSKTKNAKLVSPVTAERIRLALPTPPYTPEVINKMAKDLRLTRRTVAAAIRHLELSGQMPSGSNQASIPNP